ncbi:kinase non-catalytic C-lobe domain-containing protein 1 isoform X3 [Manis pentadactyla]|uniref:kinase non-catalytic C-lobe domain-containing protein 1 isoform X3 n=1 Tax=Manis pentadactyla TaxID=143292 RepID=UPI00255CD38A|nr:kinase non-catalytic C-lobe domain-containing protein 1 isoform X3 [Manis pentadactyla]
MQAMDPASANFYQEDGKDLDFYDFEPLPTLAEDEENVSLADILSLRDSGLSEQEAWAVCLECSLSLRSVAHAAIFLTLCITPDTLAFNTSGNVCFMEQLSDDPEGAFVPPEFDVTGNTFEAHIYSLGATLKAALEYVAEPEQEPRLSRDLEVLLGQMQAEDPGDRPDLESIIALCEEKTRLTSCHLCRSLSAVGRRVLSIESFGALQEVSENTWRGSLAPRSGGPKRQPGARAIGPEFPPTLEHPPAPAPRALLSAPMENRESTLDAQRPPGDPDRGFLEGGRLRKVQTFPRLPPEDPETRALCLKLASTKSQQPAPKPTPPDPRKELPEGTECLCSFKAQPKAGPRLELQPKPQQAGARGTSHSEDRGAGASGQGPAKESPPLPSEAPQNADPRIPRADKGIPEGAGELENTATEQGISLQDLLSKLGRPFKEYELWALSHACLSSLRKHSQHPAYLCLDSVLVAEDGAVIFGPPPANGVCNSFFLAPEAAEQRLVTEKASVYCVAAVLWMAAKFTIPQGRKLALPRRLKALLLDMARCSAQERPSAAEVIKICNTYLLQRGMDSREILAHLRSSTCKILQEEETIHLQSAFSADLSPSVAPDSWPGTGVVRVSNTRLLALRGPTSCHNGAALLPAALASQASHFKPTVLTPDAGVPSADTLPPSTRSACPSLQEATRLIQEEFAFDGYLDNGLEALIMGEYIYALRDLTYATFCGAISEKFCDLYWGEKLLQNLFQVVNGKVSPSESALEEAGPQPTGQETCAPSDCSPGGKRPSLRRAGKEKPAAARTSRGPCPPPSLPQVDSDELSRGNFEVGFRPQKSVRAERRQQPESGQALQQSGGPEPVGGASDSGAGAQLARPEEGGPAVSPSPAEFQSCRPGWPSAFYEADCFGTDVHSYVEELAQQKASGAPHADAHSLASLLEPECRQELEQQLMMEQRNYRKTVKFHQKLLQKEKRNKGSEVKTMLSKLKGQLDEMKSRVQFLSLVKKYLQVMYAERWGLEPCALPVIVNLSAAPCNTLDFSPLDESSSLIFYNVSKHPRGGRQRKARVLQAGTPLGLMAYLYSSDAFLEGYVQQFLYTFRYFCTPHDFLRFLLDRIDGTLSRAHQDPTSTFTKIYRRSLCLLQAWVEDCYAVDFTLDAGLLGRLQDFISSKILPLDGSAEHLLGLLEVGTNCRFEGAPRSSDPDDPKEAEEDARPLNALCKRLSEDSISRKGFPWRLSRGSGPALPHKGHQYTIASALPKPCLFEDFYGPYARASEKGPYFLTEYSTHQLFSQLTLLQQELFQKCHPVHFLNSRALGIVDKSVAVPRASSSEPLSAKTCSLFPPSCMQDKYLLQLLRSADDVSTWVAAEIVTSHTPKLQVDLLSKFLLVAKSCYEQRNFATAMQILGALEHLAVRQAPAWRILPAKTAEVMEELKAVEVFLKSDSLCLMEGRRPRAQPTLPSARLLAMHVQQLETGGFTMTSGAHRWSKLRNIAKVVSQVHAFQENPYTLAPDPKLQSYLKERIARFSGVDISILAADNRANSHQIASDKHSRKIQDKLRRMKATFQ